MANGLEIVSSGLLIAQVGIERSIPCRTRKVLAIFERDVLTISRFETFGQTEINYINCIFGLVIAADQKVVRFDVSMDDSFIVNGFDSRDHLVRTMKTGAQVKLASAVLELVFQTLSKEVHDHDVKHFAIFVFMVTNKMQIWNGRLSSHFMNQLGFPEKHNMLGILDSLFDLSRQDITSLSLLNFINFTEGATAQLLDNFVPLIKYLLPFLHINM